MASAVSKPQVYGIRANVFSPEDRNYLCFYGIIGLVFDDSYNLIVRLIDFIGVWWDGLHLFEEGVYSLHIRLSNISAKNRIIFWHVYAHHIFDTQPVRSNKYWDVFLQNVKTTSAWKEAELYEGIYSSIGKAPYEIVQNLVEIRPKSI